MDLPILPRTGLDCIFQEHYNFHEIEITQEEILPLVAMAVNMKSTQ